MFHVSNKYALVPCWISSSSKQNKIGAKCISNQTIDNWKLSCAHGIVILSPMNDRVKIEVQVDCLHAYANKKWLFFGVCWPSEWMPA